MTYDTDQYPFGGGGSSTGAGGKGGNSSNGGFPSTGCSIGGTGGGCGDPRLEPLPEETPSEMGDGLVCVPFEPVTLEAASDGVLTVRPQVAVRGPYRLGIRAYGWGIPSSGRGSPVSVRDIQIGNELLLVAPGHCPAELFVFDPQKAWPEGLVAMHGRFCNAGMDICLRLHNPSAARVRVCAAIWAYPSRVPRDKWPPLPSDPWPAQQPDIPDYPPTGITVTSVSGCKLTVRTTPGLTLGRATDHEATLRHMAEEARPLDEAPDAAWESATDEWP